MKQPIIFLALLMLSLSAIASEGILVQGVVTDQSSRPLKGITVGDKAHPRHKTTTDANGRYSITVPKGTHLEAYSENYITKEVLITSQSTVNFKLSPYMDVSLSHNNNKKIKVNSTFDTFASQNIPTFSASKKASSKSKSKSQTRRDNQGTEEYARISENQFLPVVEQPLSTFSIDVDRASYSNVRRFLNSGTMPPKDAVRVEEMINYFEYQYPKTKGNHPFAVNTEVSDCPWNKDNKLVLVNLAAKKIDNDHKLPPSNLVFLIDVSGSMGDHNKLPLLKQAFGILVQQLRPEDKVSIVVYAGAAGMVLPPTPGNQKETIMASLNRLSSGGGTAGGAGIHLAYRLADENFIENGNNRIILATDGDFNVGASSDEAMIRLVEQKRRTGIYITTLGFGTGNYKDAKMEKIADHGNGNYAYVDNLEEANKVFREEFSGTMHSIANDVKLQLEFNPAKVKAYRLVGYENRKLANQDFNDDTKDAGELGYGHYVTALYEIVPIGVHNPYIKRTDKLKYQKNVATAKSNSKELLNIKMRYKKPGEQKSILITEPLNDQHKKLSNTSDNFRWAASVAEFGLLLRDSKFKGDANYGVLLEMAEGAKGKDKKGYRKECIRLMEKASSLNNYARK